MPGVTLTPVGLALILLVNLLLLTVLGWPVLQARLNFLATPTSTGAATATSTPTVSATPSFTPTLDATQLSGLPTLDLSEISFAGGLIVFSTSDYGYTHIFTYQPETLPFTRLTDGPWDDITPAIKPDGTQIAFASNRDGPWDLYLLDLLSGQVFRLTDTPEYDGAPSWSPDGIWLTYETYINDNLEVFIRPATGEMEPINLSTHPGPDHSPVWSPQGRHVAFVSTRSGEPEIWLADLDKVGEERYTNASQSPTTAESHPAWSPDGNYLAWSAATPGFSDIVIYDNLQPDTPARSLGGGDWPVWSPLGEIVLTGLTTYNQTLLTAYDASAPGVGLPPLTLPGKLSGLSWGVASLPSPLPSAINNAAQLTPSPLWNPVITPAEVPGGRQQLATLPGVDAPNPSLNDLVDEAFTALRTDLANQIGWDFLSSLENAYVPITSPLPPGMGNDWLYTGRAFAIQPALINAGWMVVMREDYGQQTYWRIYLRTRSQDGSQGRPLTSLPWDFDARYSGEPTLYDQGGQLAASIPTGYWFDFTEFAAQYGWERVPALVTWRTFYQGARFNEFVLTSGLDWESAMLELYPPEILITPTALVPPTPTLTIPPSWWRSPTPTPTATQPSSTPTP